MKKLALAAAALCGFVGSASGQSIGADVTHQDIQDIVNYTPVGGIRAYSLGSYTCNLGNVTLAWVNNGTPGLAMNAYRLHNGRMQQIGMSWVKSACCAASGSGCGLTCNSGAAGTGLKPGCRDVYSGSWNGGQSRMAPRSTWNGWTGTETFNGGTTGTSIDKRLQIAQTDLTAANFPGATYFVEGVYSASDDATAGNWANNCTYKRVSVDAAYNLVLASGSQQMGTPAIQAWRTHGLGTNLIDTRVEVGTIDIPGEGRFYVANKVTDLGNGQWLYDYAVFNMNSDRSAGSFEVPVPDGVTVTNIGFSDVNYHSGEVYANTDWTSARIAGAVRWNSPQTFAQNANTNALRWGTMYNFWFTANKPARGGAANLGMFKPGTPASISPNVRVPGCPADINFDGSVDGDDVIEFFGAWDASRIEADFNADGAVDGDDVIAFFSSWDSNC
ncbi:MAG: GC-type dockerin domain-anchored protein [Phycisphaerales bacterium]